MRSRHIRGGLPLGPFFRIASRRTRYSRNCQNGKTVRKSPIHIKRASSVDASGIVAVLETICAERIHSAIDQPWSIEEERRYLESLSAREVFNVAVDGAGGIVGFQDLSLWSPMLTSMAHVGQVGTFLSPAWRGRGIGTQLWRSTEAFARGAAYRKMVIQVRAINTAAQVFYSRLGFQKCGRLARQVIIDGVEDDEVLMELFL